MVAVLILQLIVPAEVLPLPRWVLPALGAAMLVPLVWTNPFHLRRDELWLRWIEVVLIAVLVAVNAVYLIGLIVYLATGEATEGAVLVRAALLISRPTRMRPSVFVC